MFDLTGRCLLENISQGFRRPYKASVTFYAQLGHHYYPPILPQAARRIGSSGSRPRAVSGVLDLETPDLPSLAALSHSAMYSSSICSTPPDCNTFERSPTTTTMAPSTGDSETESNRPAKKRRTDFVKPEPKFKTGDWVLTNKPGYQKSNKGVRAVVQLEHPMWNYSFGEWAWAYTIKTPSGQKFSVAVRESNLTKLAVIPGDEVMSEVDGEEAVGVVARVFLDDEDEAACEVHYAREEKMDKVKKVA